MYRIECIGWKIKYFISLMHGATMKKGFCVLFINNFLWTGALLESIFGQ